MVDNSFEGFCKIVGPLSQQEACQLSESVLYRIVRGDARGRPFGSPRNPHLPTVAEFNPRVGEIVAADLAGAIKGQRHGINSEQAVQIRQLGNEEILRFNMDDPMSGHAVGAGFEITGGHHRLAEIVRRVEAGELPAATLVRILFHD